METNKRVANGSSRPTSINISSKRGKTEVNNKDNGHNGYTDN